LCGTANEGGGHLVLGITDRRPRQVVGTRAFPNPQKVEEKIFDKLKFRVDLQELDYNGFRILVFIIPSRPQGTAYPLEGAYLMRSGSHLVPMSEDRLRQIFAEGCVDWLDEFSLTGLDSQAVVELLDTQKFFELFHLPYPPNRNGVFDRLLAENLIRESGGKYDTCRLGALLFAKNLEFFPDLKRKTVRVTVYPSLEKSNPSKSTKTFTKGYATGFQGLVNYVVDQLPHHNEPIQDAIRVEQKWISPIAIRELVANALIHQDLQISGACVTVDIYSNRVEVSNPGEPLVELDRFIDGYRSRNEKLTDIMRRTGICEEQSSGIDKVIHAAETDQLPAPVFRTLYERTNVVMYGPLDFSKMDKNDRIRVCYQHCVLRYVISKPMTNQSLRERFHLTPQRTHIASQIIAQTIEEGKIRIDEQRGASKKFAQYLPYWA